VSALAARGRARGPIRRGALAACLLAGLALAGCRADDQRTDSIDPTSSGERAELPEEAVAAIDAGNEAYRTGSYEPALRHYLEAVELAPDHATGWFGVYMAHHALGNLAAADSALQRVQSLAPGASLVRPPADTSGGGS
jgi:tetratricopeptide (TPR) repeat protein